MTLLRSALAGGAILIIGVGVFYGVLQNQATDQAVKSRSVETSKPSLNSSLSVAITPMGSDNGKPIDDITALRGEDFLLRAEVSSLRRQMLTQTQSQPSASIDATSDNPDKNLRIDPLARAEAENNRKKQMAAVESDFRKERSDPKWSSRTTSLVQNILNIDDVTRAETRSVECRSQSCRIEIVDDGSGELSKTMPLLAQRFASSFPNISADQIDQGNGKVTTVLYISNETSQRK